MTLPVDDPAATAPIAAPAPNAGVEDLVSPRQPELHAADYPDALACYRRAIALAPETPELHFNLGNTFLELKSWDAAVVCFQRTALTIARLHRRARQPGHRPLRTQVDRAARSRPTARRPSWPRPGGHPLQSRPRLARKRGQLRRGHRLLPPGHRRPARILPRRSLTWGMRCRRPESSKRPQTPTARRSPTAPTMPMRTTTSAACATSNTACPRRSSPTARPSAIAPITARRVITPARPIRTRGGSMRPSAGTGRP